MKHKMQRGRSWRAEESWRELKRADSYWKWIKLLEGYWKKKKIHNSRKKKNEEKNADKNELEWFKKSHKKREREKGYIERSN